MSNPFVALEADATETSVEELPELEEYAWDFEKNTFRRDGNGKIITVTENEALKVWIYKCLKCERYRYNVYRHGEYNDICNYGIYIEKYIGVNPNNEKTASAIKKEIREGIAANPYIQKINYINIVEMKKENLTLEMSLTSIYGNLTAIFTV